MLHKAIIFDIDGTLADCTHRLHHIMPMEDSEEDNKKKDWEAFHKDCISDKPILHVIQLLNMYRLSGYSIILCTGRMEQNRAATISWCNTHDVIFDKLYMRPTDDYREDTVVKLEALTDMLGRYSIHCVIEDRSRVVKMWRDQGLHCFQVKDGDY